MKKKKGINEYLYHLLKLRVDNVEFQGFPKELRLHPKQQELLS
jgi:hypothetical protein